LKGETKKAKISIKINAMGNTTSVNKPSMH
jgi:hypothetical protein